MDDWFLKTSEIYEKNAAVIQKISDISDVKKVLWRKKNPSLVFANIIFNEKLPTN